MSTINVNNLSGKGGATPNLPDGAVISGVATVTNLKPTNVNVSGAVTATTFDGSLKSTGTPTLGLGVTINSSGVAISGVATAGILSATTLYGDGSNLTGVGESIAPWHYNPDVNDQEVVPSTGIGITFNKKVLAGSGTATLKIVNAGVAGTTVQSWGVSSCTFNVTEFTMGSLVSSLDGKTTYQLDIPEGFIVDSNETSYAGTAYTFASVEPEGKFFAWGDNVKGNLGQNNEVDYSSPIQIPGTTWVMGDGGSYQNQHILATKTDGTLWGIGRDRYGELGQNSNENTNPIDYSSPVQIPGTNWSQGIHAGSTYSSTATKTDGTLWGWGYNTYGQLGMNDRAMRSSPVQVPGTDWPTSGDQKLSNTLEGIYVIKTNGELWVWGNNGKGDLGVNNHNPGYSSPVQVPGTSWSSVVSRGDRTAAAIRTDGTLWSWGYNEYGQLGQNNRTNYSSPTQIPGTTWKQGTFGAGYLLAVKTDGTLWSWGDNTHGVLGQNNEGTSTRKSSPVQVPGTTWSYVAATDNSSYAIKTDGTLWSWGGSSDGKLGHGTSGSPARRSSPTQIGTESNWLKIQPGKDAIYATLNDTTP